MRERISGFLTGLARVFTRLAAPSARAAVFAAAALAAQDAGATAKPIAIWNRDFPLTGNTDTRGSMILDLNGNESDGIVTIGASATGGIKLYKTSGDLSYVSAVFGIKTNEVNFANNPALVTARNSSNNNTVGLKIQSDGKFVAFYSTSTAYNNNNPQTNYTWPSGTGCGYFAFLYNQVSSYGTRGTYGYTVTKNSYNYVYGASGLVNGDNATLYGINVGGLFSASANSNIPNLSTAKVEYIAMFTSDGSTSTPTTDDFKYWSLSDMTSAENVADDDTIAGGAGVGVNLNIADMTATVSGAISAAAVFVQADTTLAFENGATLTLGDGTAPLYVADGKILTIDASACDVSEMSAGGKTLLVSGMVFGYDPSNCIVPDPTESELEFFLTVESGGIYLNARKAYSWKSLNINFYNDDNSKVASTATALGVYEVPGTLWNDVAGVNGTVAALTIVDDDDEEPHSAASSASVTIANASGSFHCNSLANNTELRRGYIDDNGKAYISVTVGNVPFDAYRVIVYHATDSANLPFGWDTVNGVNLNYKDGLRSIGSSTWGNSGAYQSAEALAEGVNYLVSGIYTNKTLTIVGHKTGTGNTTERSCIAAIQVVRETLPTEPVSVSIEAPNDTDWSAGNGVLLPTTAKPYAISSPSAAAAAEASFGNDADYRQSLGGYPAAVVAITGGIYSGINGMFRQNEPNNTGTSDYFDTYVVMKSGTADKVKGRQEAHHGVASANMVQTKGNALVQLEGDAVVNYAFGAGNKGGYAGNNSTYAKLSGSSGVTIKGNAVVRGSVFGGWTSAHTANATVDGNTAVLVKNIQSLDGAANYGSYITPGWIVGGSAYEANGGASASTVTGNSSVKVDIASGSGTFVKRIVGGSMMPDSSNGNSTSHAQTVKKNSSVTIAAPLTVTFSGNIVGGGYSGLGAAGGSANVNGDASVTLTGGTYSGRIVAGGYAPQGGNAAVDGSATLTVNSGTAFSGATLDGGNAAGRKTLCLNTTIDESTLTAITGFDALTVGSGLSMSPLSLFPSHTYLTIESGATYTVAAGSEVAANGTVFLHGGTLKLTGITEEQIKYDGYVPAVSGTGTVEYYDTNGTKIADGYVIDGVAATGLTSGFNLLPYYYVWETDGASAGIASGTASGWGRLENKVRPVNGKNVAFHVTGGGTVTVDLDEAGVSYGTILVYGSGTLKFSGENTLAATTQVFVDSGVTLELSENLSATYVNTAAGASVVLNGGTEETPRTFAGQFIIGDGDVKVANGVVLFHDLTWFTMFSGGLYVMPGGCAKTDVSRDPVGSTAAQRFTGFGGEGSTITVYVGGQLDLANTSGISHNIVIDTDPAGGTGSYEAAVVNSGEAIGNGARQTSSMTVNTSATIDCSSDWGLIASGYGATTLTIAKGATLTKTGAGNFWLVNNTASTPGDASDNARFVVAEGYLTTSSSGSTLANGAALDVVVENGAYLKLGRGFKCSALTVENGGSIVTDSSDGYVIADSVAIEEGATATLTGTSRTGAIITATTLSVDGTVTAGGKTISATTIEGTGTVSYSGKLPDGTAWTVGTDTTGWRGTVVIANVTSGGYVPFGNYGNGNSIIKAPGFAGYTEQNATPPIFGATLVIDESTTFTLNNGDSGKGAIFARLSGEGTLAMTGASGGSATTQYMFRDVSGFRGAVSVNDGAKKSLVLGAPTSWSCDNSSYQKQLVIAGDVVIADGKNWSSAGGIKLVSGANVTLLGAGALTGAVTASGASKITLADTPLTIDGTLAATATLEIDPGTIDISTTPVALVTGLTAVPDLTNVTVVDAALTAEQDAETEKWSICATLADGVWNTGSGSWTASSFNGTSQETDGEDVKFRASANAAVTVTLDGTRAPANVTFCGGEGTAYTLTGGAFEPTGTVTVESGSVTIESAATGTYVVNAGATLSLTNANVTSVSGGGTLNIPAGGTVMLATAAAIDGVTALTGTGTLIMPGGGTPATALQNLLKNLSNWGGRIVISNNISWTNINPNDYGNENSKVELQGVIGYFANPTSVGTIYPEVVFNNGSYEYAFSSKDAYGYDGASHKGNVTEFMKISGTGRIYNNLDSDAGKCQLFLIHDASGFTGTIQNNPGGNNSGSGTIFVFSAATPRTYFTETFRGKGAGEYTFGSIHVLSDGAVKIGNGAQWIAATKTYNDADNAIRIAGSVELLGSASMTGIVTLLSGATITFDNASKDSYSLATAGGVVLGSGEAVSIAFGANVDTTDLAGVKLISWSAAPEGDFEFADSSLESEYKLVKTATGLEVALAYAATVTDSVTGAVTKFATLQDAVNDAAGSYTKYITAYADGSATTSLSSVMIVANGFNVEIGSTKAGYELYAASDMSAQIAGLWGWTERQCAATFVWNTEVASGDWTSAANWTSPNGTVSRVPASLDAVKFNSAASVQFNTTRAFASLEANAAVVFSRNSTAAEQGNYPSLNAGGAITTTGGGSLTLSDVNLANASGAALSIGVPVAVSGTTALTVAEGIAPTSFTGLGTIVLDGALLTGTSSETWPAAWTGTVWLKNLNGVEINPNAYGNSASTLKFTGVSCTIPTGTTCAPAFELADDGDTKALTIDFTAESAYNVITLAEIKGSGTFTLKSTSGRYPRTTFRVSAWSNFAGALAVERGRILFGTDAAPDNEDYLHIGVSADATVSVASGKPWTATQGFRVNGTLNVATPDNLTGKISGAGRVVLAALRSSAFTFESWTGTVAVPAITNVAAYLNYYGVVGSTLEIPGFNAWIKVDADQRAVNPDLKLTGAYTASSSQQTYSYQGISGTGDMTFTGDATSIAIAKILPGYTGTIANSAAGKVTVSRVVLSGAPAAGQKVLSTTTPNKVDVTAVYVGDAQQTNLILAKRDDGIYVAAVEEAVTVGEDSVTSLATASWATTLDASGINGKVAIPGTVTQITGVTAANLLLKATYTPEGGSEMTAYYPGILALDASGNVSLDSTASATVGSETVSVAPALDTAAASPMAVADAEPSFAVKTVPGLKYKVVAATALGESGALAGTTTEGASVQATSTSTTVAAPAFPAGANVLYYKIGAEL